MPTEVYLEVGDKKVFACAFDWPGWCRSGRTQEQALEALRAYQPRYAQATKSARQGSPDDDLRVVERLKGSATTDFGAPGAIPERDTKSADMKRLVSVLRAAWRELDRVVDGAPAELRKGPRGGGRDRDKIVDHVYGAEAAYARQLGIRLEQPATGDAEAVKAFRAAMVKALETPVEGAKWPAPYAARRIAWHALDHAWEIQDRSD